MDIRELVDALVRGDLLAARQWVADARRLNIQWNTLSAPIGLTEREQAIAAGMVELFASRAGTGTPQWTSEIGPAREVVILDPGLEEMPRSFAHAKEAAPEMLRKRNLLALPDFLDVA